MPNIIDDCGVFSMNLSEEYENIQQHFQLTDNQIIKLAGTLFLFFLK